jgi:hypothetical protein
MLEIGPENMVCGSETISLYWYLIRSSGNVCYLHILGQGLVFLNTPEAAADLMDKRGTIYSDKPQLVSVSAKGVHRPALI